MNLSAAKIMIAGQSPGAAGESAPALPEAIARSVELDELEALFRDHYKPVFRVALRLTGSHSDAEDVMQTIFLRLTLNRGLRNLAPNPPGYLYRAAVNASLDLLRGRRRANSVPLDDSDPEHLHAASAVATPEDNLADAELRKLLREAVAKLEGRAATAFALRYFEGRDNTEIAKLLGTSRLVVAVTLHRARTRLRGEIGNYLEKHNEA